MFQRTFSFWRRLVGRGPRPAPPPLPETDRRVWGRFPTDLEVIVHLAGSTGSRLAGKVRDVSKGGINLVVDRKFEPGDLLSVELPRNGEPPEHTVLACIVRVDGEGPMSWSLGCVFSRELTEEDLEGFGARRVRHASTDQRVWMRFPVKVRATYQKVGELETPVTPVRVVDISPTGIGLVVPQPMEAGTLLSVDLQSLNGKMSRTILACVVHVSSQANGDHSLGCNFIHELTEDDLMALL